MTTNNTNNSITKKLDLTSSIKYLDMANMSNEEIIMKFDTVLAMREHQLQELALEMSTINDKFSNSYGKSLHYDKENKTLKDKIAKLNSFLFQERNDKEILLNNIKELENSLNHVKGQMKCNINNITAGNYTMNINTGNENSSGSSNMINEKNNKEDSNSSSNTSKSIIDTKINSNNIKTTMDSSNNSSNSNITFLKNKTNNTKSSTSYLQSDNVEYKSVFD